MIFVKFNSEQRNASDIFAPPALAAWTLPQSLSIGHNKITQTNSHTCVYVLHAKNFIDNVTFVFLILFFDRHLKRECIQDVCKYDERYLPMASVSRKM